jgi:hypothetical protein
MYRNLLVPYDDSAFSRAALLEAAHWTRRHQGKLTILHAVFFDTEEFGIAPDLREKRRSASRPNSGSKRRSCIAKATHRRRCSPRSKGRAPT